MVLWTYSRRAVVCHTSKRQFRASRVDSDAGDTLRWTTGSTHSVQSRDRQRRGCPVSPAAGGMGRVGVGQDARILSPASTGRGGLFASVSGADVESPPALRVG